MMYKVFWSAFVICLFSVVVLSIVPADAFPSLRLPEILGHFAAYAALAFIGGIACRSKRSLCVFVASLGLLGAGLELIQGLLPSRDASTYELLANVIGIALGSFAAISIRVITNAYAKHRSKVD